jgi:hypothetical protein
MFSADMQQLVQQLLTNDAAQRPSLQQVGCEQQPNRLLGLRGAHVWLYIGGADGVDAMA